MALFIVTGVHLDAEGRVTRATMCEADGTRNKFVGRPGLHEASEIAQMIAAGHEVHSVFLEQGQTFSGPKFKRITLGDGREGIVLAEDIPGRSLRELAQI